MGRLCDESGIEDGEFVLFLGTHEDGCDEADVFDSLDKLEAEVKRYGYKQVDSQITWDNNDKPVRGWIDVRGKT